MRVLTSLDPNGRENGGTLGNATKNMIGSGPLT
jgi:hypothetical protein